MRANGNVWTAAGTAILACLCLPAGCGTGLPTRQGCEGPLLASPADPGLPGPWPVGVRTIHLDGIVTEVWYPGLPGTEKGLAPAVYDIRLQIPEAERGKIPDPDAPWQACACVRDLPIDDAHGPYPVMVFVHGSAAFRTQTLSLMTHWASRGLVVLSQDHPGLMLADMLIFNLDSDLPGDTARLLAALETPIEGLAFLQGRIDTEKIGLAGHSAGGMGIAGFGARAGVRLLIPMAAGGSQTVEGAEASTLVLAGLSDTIVPFDRTRQGYLATPPPRRLLGLANAGHLAFSDLCGLTNERGDDLVTIAIEHGVSNASLGRLLWDGCAPGNLTEKEAARIIAHATTVLIESELACLPGPADPLAGITALFPAVTVYEADLPPLE